MGNFMTYHLQSAAAAEEPECLILRYSAVFISGIVKNAIGPKTR